MRYGASLDLVAGDVSAPGVLAEPEPETRAGIVQQQAREDSRSTSSTSSPAPPDNEESDFFLGADDSQSSLGVPNLQEMQVNDDECLPPVHRLPNEILIAVFSGLSSSSDLLHVMMTCKRWARNAVDILWHRPSCNTWERHVSICRTLGLEKPYFYYREFIKRLNLASLADVINDGSVMPFAACTRIERLTLTGCENLTDSGLIALVSNNTHLFSLDVSRVDEITEASIDAIADNCPRLQGLNISACTKISNESLIRLAQRCRFIKRLKLNECTQVTDEAVMAFAEHCPNILEIDLEKCTNISNDPVTTMLTRARALRELRVPGCDLIDDSAFLSLPPNRQYEHLRILDLSSCPRLTDRAVERIVRVAPRLRNIVLQKCRNLTDPSVYALSELGKNLHYLHLGHCGHITDDAVKKLAASCNRLRYIDLGCCTNLTDESVTRLATLPKLKRIGLVKCHNITDASIIALANANRRPRMRKDAHGNVVAGDFTTSHSSLERVHLSYCNQLTLKGIMRLLNSCPRLTHLSLTGVPAFLREDLEQFSRETPPGFTEHQRAVFCVFSGQGVVDLRRHLNATESSIQLSMRADRSLFPENPVTGSPQGTNHTGLDDADPEGPEDLDGLEDESEMIVDALPLLNGHNTGLGLPPGNIPPPPPIPLLASQTQGTNNPGDAAGHPPFNPHEAVHEDGQAEAAPLMPPLPPHQHAPVPAHGQDGSVDVEMNLMNLTIGAGTGGSASPAPDIQYAEALSQPPDPIRTPPASWFQQVQSSPSPGPATGPDPGPGPSQGGLGG
ncbi:hypothetical protein VTK26DRAFT_6418 [Humicola hyalothermophila]